MSNGKVIFLVTVLAISSILAFQFNFDNNLELQLDKSGPYIGADIPNDLGFDGEGIKIAVIDTGVDHLHPDLFGFGEGGKIVGGYNFVDGTTMPIDTNGHGTEVTGIIAADGELKGIASKANILAYKVSDDGEFVSSQMIIDALEQAIEDDADIINISLGVNKTNPKIDKVVNKAIESGIVVVTAAGNDGPDLQTIGSPGRNSNAITVGASYNNITASIVATLEVEEKRYQAIPMIGVDKIDEPITEKIVFGKYGRERDLVNGTFGDAIVLVERGSDVEDETVYFSEKEKNVANAGAKAMLVYNSEPGIFFGELTHKFAPPDYKPRIPALSMSQEDGQSLKEKLDGNLTGTVNVFYNPDFVAYFSSRGPVSPFYIKPDLVAPGVFVNTTLSEGRYNFTSGTSFAAPHVSGAAALLLQKNQDLTPEEIKSLIVTTTDFVSDAYGDKFPVELSGAGRLNVAKAFEADLIVSPPSVTYILSSDKQVSNANLKLKSIEGKQPSVKAEFVGADEVDFSYKQLDNVLQTSVSIPSEINGEFQGMIVLEDEDMEYHIPAIIHKTEATVHVLEENGKLDFEISQPDDWSYAKISVISENTGKMDTTSVRPDKDSSIYVSDFGQYWVVANINANGETFDAFGIVNVETPSEKKDFGFSFPERPLIIIFVVVAIISLVGLKLRN